MEQQTFVIRGNGISASKVFGTLSQAKIFADRLITSVTTYVQILGWEGNIVADKSYDNGRWQGWQQHLFW